MQSMKRATWNDALALTDRHFVVFLQLASTVHIVIHLHCTPHTTQYIVPNTLSPQTQYTLPSILSQHSTQYTTSQWPANGTLYQKDTVLSTAREGHFAQYRSLSCHCSRPDFRLCPTSGLSGFMKSLGKDSSVVEIYNAVTSISQLRKLALRFPGRSIYAKLVSRIYRWKRVHKLPSVEKAFEQHQQFTLDKILSSMGAIQCEDDDVAVDASDCHNGQEKEELKPSPASTRLAVARPASQPVYYHTVPSTATTVRSSPPQQLHGPQLATRPLANSVHCFHVCSSCYHP